MGRFNDKLRWSATGLTLLSVGLFSCGGSGSGTGSVSSVNNVPVDNAIVIATLDSDGGVINLDEMSSDLSGLKVTVPIGAVPSGESYQFSIAREADQAESVSLADTSVLDGFDQLRSSEAGIHPFWGALVQTIDQGIAVTPVIKFGPEGAIFNPPLIVDVPITNSSIDLEDLEDNLSVLIGSYDQFTGEFDGERLTVFDINRDARSIRVEVPHFSSLMSAGYPVRDALDKFVNAGSDLVTRFVNVIRRANTDAVSVPDKIVPMAQEAVCSGISPSLDFDKMPNPLRLLSYLASPQLPNEGETAQQAINRLQSERVLTGKETEMEDWVSSQPAESVSVEQLFGQCFTRTNGDLMQAMLLCHNTLRGWDGGIRDLSGKGPAIHAAIQPLTPDRSSFADEVGDRYHVFGMAVYGLMSRIHQRYDGALSRTAQLFIGDDEFRTSLTAQLEECVISGDCMRDEIEYAYDLMGADLGAEFGDYLLGDVDSTGRIATGLSSDEISDFFGADTELCFTVSVAGEATREIDQEFSLSASSTSPFGPVGYQWFLNGEVIATGPEFFQAFSEPGTYTLEVVGTDDRLLGGTTQVQLTVVPPPSPDPFRIYLVTNYSSDGYITISSESSIDTPPLLSGFPGGGISNTLRAQWQYLNSGTFNTRAEAAASYCGEISCFYRPNLARFIQKAFTTVGDVGIDGEFVRQCPTVQNPC